MDLIIRQGRLLDGEGLWDVGIRAGRIEGVASHIDVAASEELDAAGRLVTPSYVNGHVHLDKCNLGDVMRPNRTNSFQESLRNYMGAQTWVHGSRHCGTGQSGHRGGHT